MAVAVVVRGIPVTGWRVLPAGGINRGWTAGRMLNHLAVASTLGYGRGH